MSITPGAAVRRLLSDADALPAKLPPKFVKAAAELDETPRRLARYRLEREGLAGAVYAALEADRDPTEDPAVVSQAVRFVLFSGAVAEAMEPITERRRAALLAEHAGDLIAAWRPLVKAAAATLARVVEALPAGTDLDDAAAVNALTPAGMSDWGAGRLAVETLARVVGSWSALVAGAGLAQVGRGTAPLILADLTADQLDDIRGDVKRVHLTGAAALDVATPEEFRARVERVAAERAQAQAARRAESDQARREYFQLLR